MSGHSKWAGIKHKKALVDAKRGKLFSKLIKEVTVAARSGGDPDKNPSLRSAVEKAKVANMPHDNIKRAIKKGTGELPGVHYEEVVYEGYGPGGVAIMVDVLTDNKNRTTADIRAIFSKKGGNLAGAGSVNWVFEKKGFIMVDKNSIKEDKLMSLVLEAGAEDLTEEKDAFHIITPLGSFAATEKALNDAGIKSEAQELTMIPNSTVKIEDKTNAARILDLVENLQDYDDTQNVYANFDIPDDILDAIEA